MTDDRSLGRMILKDALEKYARARAGDSDDHEKAVVERLKKDPRAMTALEAVANTELKVSKILYTCVQGEKLSREFRETKPINLKRLEQLELCIEDLESFTKQLRSDANPDALDKLSVSVIFPDDSIQCVKNAFYIIRKFIDIRTGIIESDKARYGRTRKSSRKGAGETAAIGWIADGVKKITGKPNTGHVAVLAEVALGLPDVITEDRVRAALKTRRRKRDAGSGASIPRNT